MTHSNVAKEAMLITPNRILRLYLPNQPRREIASLRQLATRPHSHECEVLLLILVPKSSTTTEKVDNMVVVYTGFSVSHCSYATVP